MVCGRLYGATLDFRATNLEGGHRGGEPDLLKRILIIEGAPSLGSCDWQSSLTRAGFEVTRAEFVSASALSACDLVVLDATRLEHYEAAVLEHPELREALPLVLLVARNFTADTVLRLSAAGDLILPYPLDGATLLNAVERLLKERDHVLAFAQAYRLSPREVELLRLAVLGRNNDEAAAELGCSRATVATYWNRMFRKTGVSGQRDLIILLLRSKHRSGSFLRSSEPVKPAASRSGSRDK
jgi:DNA-binding CsgD family transcriptional regulator